MGAPGDPQIAPFSLVFESFGACVGVSTNEAGIFDAVAEHLPVKSRRLASADPENRFSLWSNEVPDRAEGAKTYSLYEGEFLVLSTGDLNVALEQLARELDAVVALDAPTSLFVHAGVAGWQDGAIVIPGRSMTGKTSLVAALVKAGATYYSDEYAVFDRHGLVHPFPKPLHLRTRPQGTTEKIDATKLGGRIGTRAIPVTLLVATHYDAEAQWQPTLLSPGQAVLRLFDNTVDARRRPEGAIDIFTQVATDCVAISGPRPSAERVAPSLLALCEQINRKAASVAGSKRRDGLDLTFLSDF
jgi:hypothetical protein